MGRPRTATKERILAAAFARFSRYGFRRTSMEDIAAEAGVSRAALYGQFGNKEEIFRALSDELHRESLAGADTALRSGQPLVSRLRAAVEAKSLRFVEIAYGSPHGSELLDESNRLCGDLALAAERRFQELLARELRAAARTGEINLTALDLSATVAAELFTRAAAGLKGPGVTIEDYRERMAAWVRLFVAGLRAEPARLPASQRPADEPHGGGRRPSRRRETAVQPRRSRA